jgi:hypothetical protein
MSEDAKNGMVGLWKFDEGSGSIVHDSSGNENHGTIVPVAVEFETWGDGEFANTLSFTKKDQNHLSIPASDSLNDISKAISVVANLYPRSFPSKDELEDNIYANYVSVVQRQWADATHPDLYYLGFGPGDEVHGPDGILEYKWHLGVRAPDGTEVMADLYVPDESGKITPNQWMHLVGTYDGDTGLLCLYLNGSKIGEHTLPGEIRMDDATKINPLVIACELNQGGQPAGNLDAYVDEVRVYNRVLRNI